jgi:reactive intermediate/imine deaminase
MKQIVNTNKAPTAIGSYSQAVKVGNTVYISGQIPLKKASETEWVIVNSTDFKAHAIQVFDNLSAVAEAAGGSLEQVVKLTVYLTDMSYFSQLNEVMNLYYKPPYPARAVVAVRELPKQVMVEVDAVMVLDD